MASREYKEVGNYIYSINMVLNILLLIGGIVLLLKPDIVWLSVSVILGILMLIAGIGYLVHGLTG